jgi:hypothetical protein
MILSPTVSPLVPSPAGAMWSEYRLATSASLDSMCVWKDEDELLSTSKHNEIASCRLYFWHILGMAYTVEVRSQCCDDFTPNPSLLQLTTCNLW